MSPQDADLKAAVNAYIDHTHHLERELENAKRTIENLHSTTSQDLRLQEAAPQLLAACQACLQANESGDGVDWDRALALAHKAVQSVHPHWKPQHQPHEDHP